MSFRFDLDGPIASAVQLRNHRLSLLACSAATRLAFWASFPVTYFGFNALLSIDSATGSAHGDVFRWLAWASCSATLLLAFHLALFGLRRLVDAALLRYAPMDSATCKRIADLADAHPTVNEHYAAVSRLREFVNGDAAALEDYVRATHAQQARRAEKLLQDFLSAPTPRIGETHSPIFDASSSAHTSEIGSGTPPLKPISRSMND